MEQACQHIREHGFAFFSPELDSRHPHVDPFHESARQLMSSPLPRQKDADISMIARLDPYMRLTPKEIDRNAKVKLLREFNRRHGLPVSARRELQLGNLLSFLAEAQTEQEFDGYLEELNAIFFWDKPSDRNIVARLRTRPSLDVACLLPSWHDDAPPHPTPLPLPQYYPWCVQKELTPPLLLFRLRRCVEERHWDADNYVVFKFTYSPGSTVVLNIYQVRDDTLPGNLLLSWDNLMVPRAGCLRVALTRDHPSYENYDVAINNMCSIYTWPGMNLSGNDLPARDTTQLVCWLWRIRASDNLVVQLVQAVEDARAFTGSNEAQLRMLATVYPNSDPPCRPITTTRLTSNAHHPSRSRVNQVKPSASIAPSTPLPTIPGFLLAWLQSGGQQSELSCIRLSKERVLSTLFQDGLDKKAGDDGLILDSMVLSLRCPISMTPIVIPIRSSLCQHLQCFDFTSFCTIFTDWFGPFKCPICFKQFPFDTVIVDGYFEEIIRVARSVRNPEVRVDANTGVYQVVESTSFQMNNIDLGDGDEDLVLGSSARKNKKARNGESSAVVIDENYLAIQHEQPVGSTWRNPIVLD